MARRAAGKRPPRRVRGIVAQRRVFPIGPISMEGDMDTAIGTRENRERLAAGWAAPWRVVHGPATRPPGPLRPSTLLGAVPNEAEGREPRPAPNGAESRISAFAPAPAPARRRLACLRIAT